MHQGIIDKLRSVLAYLDDRKLVIEAAYISLVIESLITKQEER